MIVVTDGYYIDVSGYRGYTVIKFIGTEPDVVTGMEKPIYRHVRYTETLEMALWYCLEFIKADQLRNGCIELEKAMKIIRQENKKFADLLKKCMKELGEE